MQLSHYKHAWRYIDHSNADFSPLLSFAYDDTLCSLAGKYPSQAFLRSWVHRNTVVLGIQDSRLPLIKEGISFLNEKGFDVIVRNSGGLAVVLDTGILNVSLVVKEQNMFSIDDGYDLMYHFIKSSLNEVTVEAKEIVGSYCPGSYDLSVNGKKFAGISQRRMRGGVAIQIYLCVTGSGSERASLIRDFYTHATGQEKPKFNYPKIVPNTMASLSELLSKKIDTASMMNRLLTTLVRLEGTVIASHLLQEEEALFAHYADRIVERNRKVLEN